MEKCSCWEEKYQIIGWYDAQTPMLSKKLIQRCNGTKEHEECSCNGNVNKCNFYTEKRNGNQTMNTAEMVIKANKDGKTYKAYDMLYNNQLGFHDIKGKKWDADAFKYVNDIFNLEWKLKPDNEMTKSEAEKRFNIKIVGD